jgi:radical SAM superfamily enzyme YgiQ (UPF0313 family)
MKVLLISPPFGAGGQQSKGLPIAPPVLEYMAGLTEQVRPDIEVALVDANIERFDVDSVDADLVGFTVLTPQAPWAYRTADILRAGGVPVVMGGIHVTALPDEAGAHADALVLGEAESVWAGLLDDAEKRALKPRYEGDLIALEGLPRPKHGLLSHRYRFGSFFTSRGCPFSCAFCSVHKFFGGKARMRAIDEVVGEVAASSYRMFWNIDDNVWGVDVGRTIEMYEEMARQIRGKHWFGAGDLATIQTSRGDELLVAARKAGMTAAMVGYESTHIPTLEEYKAVNKQGRDRLDAVRRIRAAGIDVMLFVMVGGRQDHPRQFEEILELCDRLDVSAHPVMTTPFPGTELRDEYEPYLLPGMDWDVHDGNHALFEHPDPAMTPEFREEAVIRLRADLFTWPRMLRRIFRIDRVGFPWAHITSFFVQYPQGRAFKQYARNHFAARSRQAPGS